MVEPHLAVAVVLGVELHLAVVLGEDHSKAACCYWVQKNMAEVEEEADYVFCILMSEKEQLVVPIDVVQLQEEEGHVMRRQTKWRPSDRPGYD